MKKLLFTLFYFSVLIGYSQTVSYKIINDNPLDVSKLEVSANVTMGGYGPVFGDGEKDNDITFGVNLRASYFPIMGKIGAEITSQNSLGIINSGAFSKFNF